MKNKFNLKKIILNYIFCSYLPTILIAAILNIKFGEPQILTKHEVFGGFIGALIVMPLCLGFKNLFLEYKKIWQFGNIIKKILIIISILITLGYIYNRAKIG